MKFKVLPLLLMAFATIFISTVSVSQIYTFTNASASGMNGPTQAQVNTAYTATTLAGGVTINTQGVQEWIVPATGIYRIAANGAEGGRSVTGPALGGRGVIVRGEVYLTAGTKLYIVVGQKGGSSNVEFSSSFNGNEGAGGGGSFVAFGTTLATSTPLMVAGGGAGGTRACCGPGAGQDAATTTAGVNGNVGGAGGINGNGGANGSAAGPNYSSGGGGFFTGGQAGQGGFGGAAFVAGGIGGIGGNSNLGYNNSTDRIDGGFGSGGSGRGSSFCGGGGGGGYSGGGSGESTGPRQGGGGGSFIAASAVNVATSNGLYNGAGTLNGAITNLNAWNLNQGQVVITVVSIAATGLNFDGVNDAVNCGNNPSVKITGNFITLEAMVRFKSFRANPFEGNIINKEFDSPDMGYMLRAGSSGIVNFNIGNGSWHDLFTAANSVTLNTWYHLAATYDGVTQKIYINGVLAASQNAPGINIADNNSNLTIGNWALGGGRNLNADIDEVRIWSRALCQAEIQNNMLCELNPAGQTGLRALYHFNQGLVNADNTAINTLTDDSGNGNTGTLNGFALTGATSNWTTGNATGTCAAFAPASITCPANQSVNVTAGTCSAAVSYTSTVTGTPAPTVTYTFTGATTASGSGDGSGSLFNKGTTNVTLTATDNCGNPTCSFTVTVTDNLNPVITCPANITTNVNGLAVLASYPLITNLTDATSTFGPVTLSGAPTPPTAPTAGNPLCIDGIYNGSNGQKAQTPNIGSLNTTDFSIKIDFRHL
jgi:hypothetical protein